MITRYALFEGKIKDGELEAFRAAFLNNAVPQLKQMPNIVSLNVSFSESQDDGAAEFPIIMAVTYRSLESMTIALESPERQKAKTITERILSKYFEGHIHHHVTTSHDHMIIQETA